MNLNGRVKKLETHADGKEEKKAETVSLYPYWLSYPLDAFETNSVRPSCMAMKDGQCTKWVINGPHIHSMVEQINKRLGFNVPREFDSVEECQQVIDWLHELALEIKQVMDNQLAKSNLN